MRSLSRCRRLWPGLVCALFLIVSAGARADDLADEADLQFQLGAEHYQQGDYRGALEHFLASNRLVPNHNVGFNIAKSYEKLQQYPEAFRYYTQALEGERDEASRQRVEAALEAIQPHVATLRIETDPPGATLYIDRRDLGPRGTSPRVLGLSPGHYRVIADLSGYLPAESQEIDAPQGGETTVKLTLAPRLEGVTGNLVVNADEPGALIEIDGKPRAFTPSILTLPAGRHRVRLSLKGFRTVDQSVDVPPNSEARLEVTLVTAEEVTAASRVAEAVEDAPSDVSIIPSEELRGMGYPTVAEALRGTRGVFVSDDRSYATVGFRGLGRLGDYGNRVLVLLDGQPTNDDWIGSSYVGYDARVDLADIDRIEVVRGPGSVLYGTNAFSGVINLVTRGTEGKTSREVGVSTADDGVARVRARYNLQEGPLGVWMSAAAARGSGRDFYFPEFAGPMSDGMARNIDGFQAGTLNGRLTYRDFTVLWLLHARDKNVPTAEYETLFGDGRFQQKDTRGLVELRFEPKVDEQLSLMSRAHVNYYAFHGTYPRDLADGGVEQDTFDGTWAGFEQRVAYSPTPRVRLTVGGEAQAHFVVHQKTTLQDPMTSATTAILDDREPFQVFAGYLLADVGLSDEVRISGGSRLDHYSTFGSSNNPRVALIARPYERGNLKVMFGKAFRAPSIYELYYNDGGSTQRASPGLEPESIYSGEIELDHRLSTVVTATVAAYGNLVRDLIVIRGSGTPADPATGTPEDLLHYENAATPVLTVGAEAGIRREWRQGWMLGASYSYQHSRYLRGATFADIRSTTDNPDLRRVPNAPEHLASVRGAVPILSHALLASTRLSFEGPRFDRHDQANDPVAQSQTESALIWDLAFTGEEPRWGVHYAIGVYNVFDWRYSVPVSNEFTQNTIQQNGRTLMASADVTF